jgi:hypothetical protein
MHERPHDSAHERGERKLSEYTLPDSGGAATHQKLADDLKDIAPESLIHLIPYTGFPRVLNAMYVVKKVFAQRQVETPQP